MALRRVLVLAAMVLAAYPSVARAQAYVGLSAGVGGATTPIGSYAAGFRGALRLYGGYEFTRYLSAEVMTFDLGTPANRRTDNNENTIGAFGIAAVGTWPVRRWDFSGRLGLMSMEGRGTTTVKSAQPMVGLGAAFRILRRLSVGVETSTSRADFGSPVNDLVRVNWSTVGATFRF
jgi:hypothetical protein